MKRYQSSLRYSIYGFLAGTVLSSAYALFGPWELDYWPEPLWARIALYPGVAAGHLVYAAGWDSILACQIVGAGSMGIVAAVIGCAWAILIEKREQGHPRP